MAGFLVDAQELKPGLIIFRRADVRHKNWYCRIKVPQESRYKTVSLKTSNLGEARDKAFDHDADVRFRKKHDVPIFERSFTEVAKEYLARMKEQAEAGEMRMALYKMNESLTRRFLMEYIGGTQITLIGEDKWKNYPTWRRKTALAAIEAAKAADGGEARKTPEPPKDGTIRREMIEFRRIMSYAAEKNYIRENQIPKGKIVKGKSRREEFTPQEYRHLHTFARGWIKKAPTKRAEWYRTMAYNFVLIMANTGMRPTEAKNLRWRDVDTRIDRQGRSFVVLNVRGKDKYRELVAAHNVAEYFDRIRKIAKSSKPDDFVFTTYDGKVTRTIYKELIATLLEESGLLMSAAGSRRCSYCFRHTYATFRLMEGIDVYFLAKQMGTSVKMIEEHYGHITPTKNAERILEGMPGWESGAPNGDSGAGVNAGGAVKKNSGAVATKAAKPKPRKR